MLKTLIAAALLTASAAAPHPTIDVAPPDYSGAWKLDKARSTGLPPFYASITSHRLAVRQTESRLEVDVVIEGVEPQPEHFEFVYPLDGSEGTTTTRVRTPNGALEVPARLRARHGDDGRLHITITREMPMRGQTVTATGTEEWELSADGRTLTVHRVEQMRQGAEMRFDMVFVRDA